MRAPPACRRPTIWGWGAAGVALITIHAALLGISDAFAHGRPVLERPVGPLVGLLAAAGGIYLFAVFLLKRPARPGPGWWGWMLGVGLALRILMLPAGPMLDDDHYRYLWDGGVAAHGHDPYAHAPEAVRNGDAAEPLLELAEASGPVIDRVNHPHLRTIYPAVAQGAFALAHRIAPWRIEGLRAVWFLLDAATLGLLVLLLREIELPASAAVIHWWNPLLIKEVYNTAHMEMVVLPFMVGALLLAVRKRIMSGTGVLGLAAGAKLWPALLLPAIVQQPGIGWRRWLGAGAVFGAVAAALVAPLLLSALGEASGLRAYAGYWRMNDTLYQLFYAAGHLLVPAHPHEAARLMIGGLLIGWIAWLCRRPAQSGSAPRTKREKQPAE